MEIPKLSKRTSKMLRAVGVTCLGQLLVTSPNCYEAMAGIRWGPMATQELERALNRNFNVCFEHGDACFFHERTVIPIKTILKIHPPKSFLLSEDFEHYSIQIESSYYTSPVHLFTQSISPNSFYTGAARGETMGFLNGIYDTLVLLHEDYKKSLNLDVKSNLDAG